MLPSTAATGSPSVGIFKWIMYYVPFVEVYAAFAASNVKYLQMEKPEVKLMHQVDIDVFNLETQEYI